MQMISNPQAFTNKNFLKEIVSTSQDLTYDGLLISLKVNNSLSVTCPRNKQTKKITFDIPDIRLCSAIYQVGKTLLLLDSCPLKSFSILNKDITVFDKEIKICIFSRSGLSPLSVCSNGSSFFTLEDGQNIQELNEKGEKVALYPSSEGNPCFHATLLSHEHFLIKIYENKVAIFNQKTSTWQTVEMKDEDIPLLICSFYFFANQLICGFKNYTYDHKCLTQVSIIDLETGKTQFSYKNHNLFRYTKADPYFRNSISIQEGEIRAITYDEAQKKIYLGNAEGMIACIDLIKQQHVEALSCHTAGVCELFLNDSCLISTSNDYLKNIKQTIAWDLENLTKLEQTETLLS